MIEEYKNFGIVKINAKRYEENFKSEEYKIFCLADKKYFLIRNNISKNDPGYLNLLYGVDTNEFVKFVKEYNGLVLNLKQNEPDKVDIFFDTQDEAKKFVDEFLIHLEVSLRLRGKIKAQN
jgi:hypothetical protein